MMSLKTMPGFGKSGTSRIFAFRSTVTREPSSALASAQAAPEEQLRELLRQLGERLEVLEPGLPALGVPRAQRRRDDLLEQAGSRSADVWNVRRCRGVDAEPRELRAGRGDLDVASRGSGCSPRSVARLRAARTPRARVTSSRRDPGARAELVEVELLLLAPPAPAAAGACVLLRRRRQLLPDHAQRQELVALEAQDRLEPLDVRPR